MSIEDLAHKADLLAEQEELLALLLEEEGFQTAQTQTIQPRQETGAPSLSFAQQRLWFLDQLEPGTPVYNIPTAFRLSGPLNVAALEQSLNEIVRRHEALRTTFAPATELQPVQVIAPELRVTLPVVDLRPWPETERETEARRLAVEEARQPFDLAHGPLFRVKLLQLAAAEHILLITMHHIVSDGWSMGLFNRELTAVYEAFAAGKPSPLAELPIQYADFACWQRQWLSGEVLERQLTYWKQQLGQDLSVLQLPTDRPRPAVQTYRGATHTFRLPHSLTEALKALSQQADVTLFMTLLAAFKALFYRYTGQGNIAVGSPIANRNLSEIEGLIGFFVNTLVLRTDLSGNPTFRELLERVREVALGAYAHQDLPFEQLVEALQPERNLSHAPLFQVMFGLQNAPVLPLQLAGLTVRPLKVERGTAKFDLSLFLTEDAQGLIGALEYNTDLFDGATIVRLVGHFQTLLAGIVADPEQRLLHLPLLTEAERHQLLVAWDDTVVDYPQAQGTCLHQLFEAQVVRTPEAEAVVLAEEALTYRVLNQRANQLARYLQRLGVGPEVRVGVCMERSLEMVIGIYGILKAGGAYVPLDPTYPPERLAFMLKNAQVPVLLTQARLAPTLPEHKAKVVQVDADWAGISRESTENPVSGVGPENLAYVIYTSGSTGKPKGAMNTHQAICNRLLWMQAAYQLTPADRVLQKTPFSFDVSVWEFFWPLLTGARLVVARPEGHKDRAYLVNLIAEQQITTLHFVPSMLQVFLEAEGLERCGCLKRVICSGEALPFDLQERFFARLPAPTELHNLYGPTEAAVDVTYWACRRQSERQIVPIGRPIANIQIYLLDAQLQPVPVGLPGELHIGGIGLARGYLNRPDLTAEKFIPNPFARVKENGKRDKKAVEAQASPFIPPPSSLRLYKTGDLARYLPDGNIEYLGRIDHQVKIRGFRIELGEIEAILSQHPAVREAVVVIREDGSDKRLVTYLVSQEQPAPASSELRSYLSEKLPDYMVPASFVFMETLPLTPNGKVDRRALPPPDTIRPELSTTYVAPRDPLELQLAQIWADLLDIQPVGITDNFFDLGGHSLLAVRLMAQIQQQFGQDLPLATLFQGATIIHLASVLRQQTGSGPQSPLVTIQPAGSKRPFFCVHPADGTVLRYVDLARYLGLDQPFYGLQVVAESPPPNIETMASHYLDALRTVQLEGPYRLGGWSMGGVVAFEMAQQLHQQGQRVALLALLDSWAPHSDKTKAPVDAAEEDTKLLAAFLRDLRGRFAETPADPAELSILSGELEQLEPDELLTYMLEQAKLLEHLLPEGGLVQIHRLLQIFKANVRAMRRYQPRPYPGRIVLFQASELFSPGQSKVRPADHLDFATGWGRFSSEPIAVHSVPGDHYTMLSMPNVQILAERLATCLAEAATEEADNG